MIVGSELNGTRTKKEEVVEEALQQLLGGGEAKYAGQQEENLARQDIVMVGDRKFDIEGAKAYHIASIGVTYGYAAEGELEEAGADVIVETVEELEKTLNLS